MSVVVVEYSDILTNGLCTVGVYSDMNLALQEMIKGFKVERNLDPDYDNTEFYRATERSLDSELSSPGELSSNWVTIVFEYNNVVTVSYSHHHEESVKRVFAQEYPTGWRLDLRQVTV